MGDKKKTIEDLLSDNEAAALLKRVMAADEVCKKAWMKALNPCHSPLKAEVTIDSLMLCIMTTFVSYHAKVMEKDLDQIVDRLGEITGKVLEGQHQKVVEEARELTKMIDAKLNGGTPPQGVCLICDMPMLAEHVAIVEQMKRDKKLNDKVGMTPINVCPECGDQHRDALVLLHKGEVAFKVQVPRPVPN